MRKWQKISFQVTPAGAVYQRSEWNGNKRVCGLGPHLQAESWSVGLTSGFLTGCELLESLSVHKSLEPSWWVSMVCCMMDCLKPSNGMKKCFPVLP